MNLVQLQIVDSYGICISEYLFHTNKPRNFFCDLDHNISDTFIEWLKNYKPELYKSISDKEFTIFYYHEDSIDIIL